MNKFISKQRFTKGLQNLFARPILDSFGDWLANRQEAIYVTLIVVFAALNRFWQLGSLPVGLSELESRYALAASTIAGNTLPPIYSNDGLSGLFVFMQSVPIAIFGNTTIAARLLPAIFGVAAVVVVYFVGKEWFRVRVGLWAVLFMAILSWAVQVGRLALPYSLGLLLLLILGLCLGRALNNNRARWWAASGVVAALGLYLDLQYYPALLLIGALLIFAIFLHKRTLKQLLQPLIIFALSALITLIPLLVFIITNPDTLMPLWIDSLWQGLARGEIGSFLLGVISSLGVFHFGGDRGYLFGLGGAPMLNIFIGTMLILGLILAVRRRSGIRYISLLIGLGVFLLPNLSLSLKQLPSGSASFYTLPFVCLLAAIGIVELVARWRGVFPKNTLAHHLMFLIIMSTVAMSLNYEYQRYFVAFANAPSSFEVHQETASEIARLVSQLPSNEVTVTAPQRLQETIRYLGANEQLTFVAAEDLAEVDTKFILIEASNFEGAPSGYSCLDYTSSHRYSLSLFYTCLKDADE